MSTKPSIIPTWKTDGSNRTSPTSGQRTTGYGINAIPTSGVFNNEANLYGQWFQYVNDGAFSGNHSIAGTLEVVSGLTVDADAVLAGAITIGGQAYAFTDFTFTANAGTDVLTATAHPMLTGVGPVRVSNSGGALPGGLTAGVDVWAIGIDANTFKLATSQANAVAGIAIDITSNGTGTQTLLHQAGTTRISDATVTRNLAVGYNATVGGALGVTGAATVGGVLTPSGGIAAFTANGLVTANAGVTVATGQAVTLSGTATLTVGGNASVGGTLGVTGDFTESGQFNTVGAITEAGVISTTLNSATLNDDFNASGIGTASVIRMATSSGAASIAGLNASVSANRSILIVNVSASNITVKHEASTSSAQFRFLLPNSADVVIRPNGSVRAWYDLTSTRYRLLAI